MVQYKGLQLKELQDADSMEEFTGMTIDNREDENKDTRGI